MQHEKKIFNINIRSVGIVSKCGFFSATVSTSTSAEESSLPHILQNSSVGGYFLLQDSQNLDKSILGLLCLTNARFSKQCGQLSGSEGCCKSHLSQLEKSLAIFKLETFLVVRDVIYSIPHN